VSIITDALKKAELDREQKAKHAAEEALERAALTAVKEQEEIAETAIAEEVIEEEVLPAPTPIPAPTPRLEKVSPVYTRKSVLPPYFREVAVFGAVVLGILLLLLVIPKWPGVGENLTVLWHPGQNWEKAKSTRVEASGLNVPFTLSGVSNLGDERYAFINGEILTVGDSIQGAYVLEILDHGVVLETKAGEIKIAIQS
jgi:hypothetical protein